MIGLLVAFASAGLIAASRTSHALLSYFVLAAAAVAMSLADVPHAGTGLLSLGFAVALKLIVAPLSVIFLVRRHPSADDLHSGLTFSGRIVVVLLLAALAEATASMPALRGLPLCREIIFALLCGSSTMVVHRNLMAGIVGLLSMDAAVTLAGAEFAPLVPHLLDLFAAFDVLVVTVIAVSIARELHRHYPAFDVRSLRKLRG
jgi:hydrogenase-4 membrane subunit HyfE